MGHIEWPSWPDPPHRPCFAHSRLKMTGEQHRVQEESFRIYSILRYNGELQVKAAKR